MRLAPAFVFLCVSQLLSSSLVLAADNQLTIKDRYKAPMMEISGVAVSQDRAYFASDREHNILSMPIDSADSNKVDVSAAETLKVELNIPSNQQAQWEAIAVSAREGVFLIKETGSEVFHYNAGGQLIKKYALKAWSGRKNPERGFEGLFLLKNGHFLIALETEPSALIEYGPKGDEPVGLAKNARVRPSDFVPPAADELVPLASWTTDKNLGACQYSDLAESPTGGLYILMKSCMKVVRVDELKPSRSTFSPTNVYSIPAEVYHPEGLQVLDNGDFIIATDIKESKTNLYRLTR